MSDACSRNCSQTQSLAEIGYVPNGSTRTAAQRSLTGRATTPVETSEDYLSWGRVHRFRHYTVRPTDRTLLPGVLEASRGRPVLGYGLGRSYGDSCLNEEGVL